MKNKKTLKILSLVLCCALLCGMVGAAAYAAGSKNAAAATVSASSSSSEDSGEDVNYKDETVYVIASSDGTPEKIIVSDWIKNNLKSDTISDTSNLADVENLKGDETYVMNGSNMRVWDAQGNDIYSQGESSQTLPVTIAVSYTLDGKSISPEDLAGKSGHVTIHFDYVNNQKETVQIDGKNTQISVPFVMLTGMMLDNDVFTNVTVTNGKIINDGDRTIVAGLALPGLAEDLDLNTDDYSLPESVEISADVTGFDLSTTMTLAMNDMFSKVDLDSVDSLDDLTSQLDTLTSSMNELIDGSSQLYDGLSTLMDKSGELISGIDTLDAYGKQLASGAASVDAGAAELQSYIGTLASGLNQLSANSASLDAGAEQVFDTLLSTANTELKSAGLDVPSLTIDNYDTVLSGVLANLDESSVRQLAYNTAYAKVEAAVRQNEAYIRSQVEQSVRATVLESVLSQAGMSMSASDYAAAAAAGQISADVQAQVSAAVDAAMASSDIQAKIDAATEQQIQSLISQNMSSSDVQSQIDAAVTSAQSGASSISALKEQLDSYNTFYQGLKTYTSGVDSAASGASSIQSGAGTLKSGTASLKSGAAAVSSGLDTLQSGTSTLQSGVGELKDGSMTLTEGLQRFNTEGIQKIADAGDGLNTFVARLRAIVDVSKDYKSFTGLSDDMDGSVKFIYKTEAISTDSEN